MRNYAFTISTLLLLACNNKSVNIKIEKFVWIQHNQNWIWNPEDLKARIYIEYFDSCNQVNFSKIRTDIKQTDYFVSIAPDSLRKLIFENLYGKNFPLCLVEGGPPVYDGDLYCIIYKFSNDAEHIINYMPYAIPDSLKQFTHFLENLSKISTYNISDSFDVTSNINKYRNKIVPCGPLAPPPAPVDDQVKYIAPVIVDTLSK